MPPMTGTDPRAPTTAPMNTFWFIEQFMPKKGRPPATVLSSSMFSSQISLFNLVMVHTPWVSFGEAMLGPCLQVGADHSAPDVSCLIAPSVRKHSHSWNQDSATRELGHWPRNQDSTRGCVRGRGVPVHRSR